MLTRLDGVKDIDISLENQSVKVKTRPDISYDAVLEAIKKTGKTVREGRVVA